MQAAEVIGYIAAFLVLAAFYMQSMVALRCTAIASNIAFITYGWFGDLAPVLILHILLLPLNTLRLAEWYRCKADRPVADYAAGKTPEAPPAKGWISIGTRLRRLPCSGSRITSRPLGHSCAPTGKSTRPSPG